MNRKNNKRKGFTIVELVIVIAVIGILAGVMIPTFGGIIEKANESNRDSHANIYFKDSFLTAWDFSTGAKANGWLLIESAGDAKDYYYEIEDSQLKVEGNQSKTSPAVNEIVYTIEDGKVVATKVAAPANP